MKQLFALMLLPLSWACATSPHPKASAPLSTTMNTTQALLVLDMQNDFCHPDGKMHAVVANELQRTDLVDSTLQLIQAARNRDVLTVVSPIEFDYSKAPVSPPEGIVSPIAEQRAFERGTFGGELFEPFAQLTSEPDVVRMPKPGLSAFAETDLHQRLQDRDVAEVVIAGLLTNLCVENTARDAFDLGYRVRVVGDATATFDETQQEYATGTIFPMLGRVITVEDFAAAR